MEPELNYSVYEDGSGWRVLWSYDGPTDFDWKGRLSVSRIPNHAFYYPSEVANHNRNGPRFATAEDALMLVNRVAADFKKIKAGGDPSTELNSVSRGQVAPKLGGHEEEIEWEQDEDEY